MEPCANCGAAFESTYCPDCGQKRHKPGIRLGEVLHEVFGTITHAEGPFPKTLLTFLRGPGSLTRAFVAGKRKSFVPPVRYFLFGIGYYYLVRFLFHWDPVESAIDVTTGGAAVETPLLQVNHWMSRHVNLLLPLLIIILASLDRILFPRTTLTWTERVVHFTFAVGTYLLVASTLLPLALVWPSMVFVNFLVIIGILMWSSISLHRGNGWAVIKSVVMVPVSFWLYIIACTVLVALMLGLPLAEVFARPTP